MLKSAEHGICLANKSINLKLLTIPNFSLLNIAEHEHFSATKYENAGIFKFISRKCQLSLAFSDLAEKISCSVGVSADIGLQLGKACYPWSR